MKLLLPAVSLLIASCMNPEEEELKKIVSFEIVTINGRQDTVNRTDRAGRKQGKWIPSVSNNLTDTFFYVDDEKAKDPVK